MLTKDMEKRIHALALRDLIVTIVVGIIIFGAIMQASKPEANVLTFTSQSSVDYIILNNQIVDGYGFPPEVWEQLVSDLIASGDIVIEEPVVANVPIPAGFVVALLALFAIVSCGTKKK